MREAQASYDAAVSAYKALSATSTRIALREARQRYLTALRREKGVECRSCGGDGFVVLGWERPNYASLTPPQPIEEECPCCDGTGLYLTCHEHPER